MRHISARCILAAFTLLFIASQGAYAAEPVDYIRNGSAYWDTAVDNTTSGSDSEASGAGNCWQYEWVTATAADNALGQANPWYTLASSGTFAFWNATSGTPAGRWEAPSDGGQPRMQRNYLIIQDSSANYGKVPRIVWIAPEAGTATITGSLGFQRNAAAVNTLDWAIGKKSGATYTMLASGTQVDVGASEVRYDLSVADLAALQDIELEGGEGLWWSFRSVSGGDGNLNYMFDGQYDATSTVVADPFKIAFTAGPAGPPPAGVNRWTAFK